MQYDESTVKYGCLVEVVPGPLRIWDDTNNFGIVVEMRKILGLTYADVVTNSGRHRLILPEYLSVLSQSGDER
jgi:hypothetical protein